MFRLRGERLPELATNLWVHNSRQRHLPPRNGNTSSYLVAATFVAKPSISWPRPESPGPDRLLVRCVSCGEQAQISRKNSLTLEDIIFKTYANVPPSTIAITDNLTCSLPMMVTPQVQFSAMVIQIKAAPFRRPAVSRSCP